MGQKHNVNNRLSELTASPILESIQDKYSLSYNNIAHDSKDFLSIIMAYMYFIWI